METLRIDEARRCAYIGARRIALTKLEYEALRCLGDNQGQVVAIEQLVMAMYPEDRLFYGISDDQITNTIARVRRKLNPHGHHYVQTVRGVGYIATNVVVARKNLNRTYGVEAYTDPSVVQSLTNRELEILELLTDPILVGATDKGLALHMEISYHTLKKHLTNMYKKLNIGSRAQAVQFAHVLLGRGNLYGLQM